MKLLTTPNPAIEKYRQEQLKALRETTELIGQYRKELMEEMPTITDAEFRETWLPLFFHQKEPNLLLWVRNVCINPNRAVRIVNASGNEVCVVPPIFAAKGTTICRGDSKEAKLNQVLSLQNARARNNPSRREEILIDAMSPYVGMGTKDRRWELEWVRLCQYFEIPVEKWLVEDNTGSSLSDTKENRSGQSGSSTRTTFDPTAIYEEDDDDYGDATEI